jgi:hypothetical protein
MTSKLPQRIGAQVVKLVRNGRVIYDRGSVTPKTVYTPEPGPGPFYPGDTLEYSVTSNPAVCTNQSWAITNPSPPYDFNWPLPADASTSIVPPTTAIPISQTGSVIVTVTFAKDTPPSNGTGYEYETDFAYTESGTTTLNAPCPPGEVDRFYLLTNISNPPLALTDTFVADLDTAPLEPGVPTDPPVKSAALPVTSSASNLGPDGKPFHSCSVALHLSPESGNQADPKSPVQYYLQLDCSDPLKTAQITGVTNTFTSFEYNLSSGRAVAVSTPTVVPEQLCTLTYNAASSASCLTASKQLPNPAGRSSEIWIQSTVADNESSRVAKSFSRLIAVNDRTVSYPGVSAAPSTSGDVPFPKGHFVNCITSSVAGCSAPAGVAAFRKLVSTYYQDAGYTIPAGVNASPPLYDSHHVLPIRWGGPNHGSNGFFLTNAANEKAGGSNDHQIFTTWFCNFSLPVTPGQPAPAPTSNSSCAENPAD